MPAAYEGDLEFEAWVDELPEELRGAARANALECEAQGLPVLLDDPVALERCARIVDTPSGTPADAAEAAS
jgi:hypothetical protein